MRLIIYVLLSLMIRLPLIAMDIAPIEIEKEFAYLQAESDKFFGPCDARIRSISFPTTNRMRSFVERAEDKSTAKKLVVGCARNVTALINPKILLCCQDYFDLKKEKGTDAEKQLYSTMTLPQFIYRLYYNRPLAFYGSDTTLLRPNYAMKYPSQNKTSINSLFPDSYTAQNGKKFFISADQNLEALTDYLCYNEILVAALLGISSPTPFINKGGRYNKGDLLEVGKYEDYGIYAGLVGARLEELAQGLMERPYILIPDSNNPNIFNEIKDVSQDDFIFWQNFYDTPYLNFNEIEQLSDQEKEKRFFKHEGGKYKDKLYYFDKDFYQKRIEIPLSLYLEDMNNRAKEVQKSAYGHVIGLGLGVWAADNIKQAQIMLAVIANLIQKGDFSNIGVLDFSWFPEQIQEIAGVKNGKKLNGITIYFSKRDPADKLPEEHKDKLLYAMYAWDGNAYVGNEYWKNILTESGDPAAVCCSLIGEIQNPLINGHYLFMNILSAIAKYMPDKATEMKLLMRKAQAEYRIKIEKQEVKEQDTKPIPQAAAPENDEWVLEQRERAAKYKAAREKAAAFKEKEEQEVLSKANNEQQEKRALKDQIPQETKTGNNPAEGAEQPSEQLGFAKVINSIANAIGSIFEPIISFFQKGLLTIFNIRLG